MNERTALDKGWARRNDDIRVWRDGYHVQYANPDGTTYDSWSPKETFERTYMAAESVVDRLNIEYYELGRRLNKLDALFRRGIGDVVDKVGLRQAVLLAKQKSYMHLYASTLVSRIHDLTSSHEECE